MSTDDETHDIVTHEIVEVVGALQTLLLSTRSTETFLDELATLACEVVDPPASCGITTAYDGHPATIAASDARAAVIDEHQYGAGQGPCLEAFHTGLVVEVRDQVADERWPIYRMKALAQGVRCSLSLPLKVEKTTLGALNLYAYDQPDAFDTQQRRRAALFAAQAGAALALAVRYTEQQQLAQNLEQALISRSVIDQAIGILMAQQECSATDAFGLLRQHSQNNNRKLHDVAADVVTRLTGQAPVPPQPFSR